MSANLDALVDGIRNKRKEKLPQAKARLEKLKAAKEAVLTTRTRAAAVAANNPELQAKLRGVDYTTADKLLDDAITSANMAIKRLQRESINIGVAGMARQGKSMILQMLTGLGDKQIPTGDGGYCTGSRSVIRNADVNRAVACFKTEADLMQKVVFPLCKSLGVSPCPGSVNAFMQATLPIMSTDDDDKVNDRLYLDRLQNDLRNNPELLSCLGSQPKDIRFDEIRSYVTKDEGDTKYQVVDHVEIDTCFDSGLPKGMLVFDLPGLKDPAPGIREAMLNSLKEDSDIVFLIRRPDHKGDGWGTPDKDIMKLLRQVYGTDGVEPKDWILLVLNHVQDRDAGNENNVDRMLQEVPIRYPGFRAVKCNCANKDDVREMVNANIETLISQTNRIDDLRIDQADVSFNAAMGEVRALYDVLRNASGDVVAQESGFNFEDELRGFMGQLRGPFKKNKDTSAFRNTVSEILALYFKKAENRFCEIYDENDSADKFPPELPIFSRRRLINDFDRNDPYTVVEETVRHHREAVLKLLRENLSKCCEELVASYYDCVVKTGFESNLSLNHISAVSNGNVDSFDRLKQFLVSVRASGTFPTIESAVEGLLGFDLTFDNSILPALYSLSELEDFNPDRAPESKEDGSHELDDVMVYLKKGLCDSESRATAFYNWLRQKSECILSCVTSGSMSSPLYQITEHIANTMRANYDAFVFRFIYGETTADEWRRLADRNKAIFWKEEFDKAAANSQIAKDWQSAIAGLASAL